MKGFWEKFITISDESRVEIGILDVAFHPFYPIGLCLWLFEASGRNLELQKLLFKLFDRRIRKIWSPRRIRASLKFKNSSTIEAFVRIEAQPFDE